MKIKLLITILFLLLSTSLVMGQGAIYRNWATTNTNPKVSASSMDPASWATKANTNTPTLYTPRLVGTTTNIGQFWFMNLVDPTAISGFISGQNLAGKEGFIFDYAGHPYFRMDTNGMTGQGLPFIGDFLGDGSALNNLPLSGLQSGGAVAGQFLGFNGSVWEPVAGGGGTNAAQVYGSNVLGEVSLAFAAEYATNVPNGGVIGYLGVTKANGADTALTGAATGISFVDSAAVPYIYIPGVIISNTAAGGGFAGPLYGNATTATTANSATSANTANSATAATRATWAQTATNFIGQLSPTNWNYGTGAAASTYARGDGTWAQPGDALKSGQNTWTGTNTMTAPLYMLGDTNYAAFLTVSNARVKASLIAESGATTRLNDLYVGGPQTNADVIYGTGIRMSTGGSNYVGGSVKFDGGVYSKTNGLGTLGQVLATTGAGEVYWKTDATAGGSTNVSDRAAYTVGITNLAVDQNFTVGGTSTFSGPIVVTGSDASYFSDVISSNRFQAYGGAASLFDSLVVSNMTQGSVVVAGVTNKIGPLAPGTAGYALITGGGVQTPYWSNTVPAAATATTATGATSATNLYGQVFVSTNGINTGTFTFGQNWYTNISANITLGNFGGVAAYDQYMIIKVFVSGGNDRKVTMPTGVHCAGKELGAAGEFWGTNNMELQIFVENEAGTRTNAISMTIP